MWRVDTVGPVRHYFGRSSADTRRARSIPIIDAASIRWGNYWTKLLLRVSRLMGREAAPPAPATRTLGLLCVLSIKHDLPLCSHERQVLCQVSYFVLPDGSAASAGVFTS